VKAAIETETGVRPWFALEAFPGLAADVRQSVARIAANPFLPHKDKVRGFIYDVKTGRSTAASAGAVDMVGPGAGIT
jgi:carbonic anhydrase